MQQNQTTTVAEIAAGSLAAVRVFERLGIDYCCGGKRPLEEVCRAKGLDPVQVQGELDTASKAPDTSARDWNTAPLHELIAHIVDTHHSYLRREFNPLSERLAKVYRVYNERYGDTFIGLPAIFDALRSELEMHMHKEERILFPAIASLERAVNSGAPAPQTPFGTVDNPIRMMEAEHESAGQALAEIRSITNHFEIPDFACVTYRALVNGLKELEQDLHLHIHLENNVLFPRAAELENRPRP
jgi:regulator of cell morphogenesis and NO signaling